jgi:hypothetical protein
MRWGRVLATELLLQLSRLGCWQLLTEELPGQGPRHGHKVERLSSKKISPFPTACLSMNQESLIRVIGCTHVDSTASRSSCEYCSDSTWAVLVLALAQSASGSLQNDARSYLSTPLTDVVTSVTVPCCLSRRALCHPPGPVCARCGSEPASVTAPGHSCWLGQVPPARTSPSRLAGWALTADRYRSAGPACRASLALILGVSWAARCESLVW